MTWRPKYSWRTLLIFTLLCTSGFGLWWNWEPWYQADAFLVPGLVFSLRRLPDAEGVEMRHGRILTMTEIQETISIYSPATRVLRQLSSQDRTFTMSSVREYFYQICGAPTLSPNGRLVVRYQDGSTVITDTGDKFDPGHLVLHDRRGNRTLLVLGRSTFTPTGHPVASFSRDGNVVVAACKSGTKPEEGLSSSSEVRVFYRRKPEDWWGFVCLKEFWLTAAFAGLFVWSVVRDRHRIGARSEPTE